LLESQLCEGLRGGSRYTLSQLVDKLLQNLSWTQTTWMYKPSTARKASMGSEEGLIGAASLRRHLGVYLPDHACRDGTFGASLACLSRLCVSKIESRMPLFRVLTFGGWICVFTACTLPVLSFLLKSDLNS